MLLLRIGILPKALPTPPGNGLRFEVLFIFALLYYRTIKPLELTLGNRRLIASSIFVSRASCFLKESFLRTSTLVPLNSRVSLGSLTYPSFIHHRHFSPTPFIFCCECIA